jgi:hypothetical protein
MALYLRKSSPELFLKDEAYVGFHRFIFVIIFILMNYEGLAIRMCGTIEPALSHKTQQEKVQNLCKVLAIPLLLYGSEFWTLSYMRCNKLKLLKVRFLRPVAGY